MSDWEMMFEGVQNVVRFAINLDDGLRKTVDFALQHRKQFDKPDFWQRVNVGNLPVDAVMSWAREGFEHLEPCDDWSLILLDCGDCPEIFRLMEFQLASRIDFAGFRDHVTADVIQDFSWFQPGFPAPNQLTYHNVRELNHPLLSWNQIRNDFCENNEYLLWLALSSLALCEPLRNTDFRHHSLRGRKNILLMSGFEEIFLYLATLTETELAF